MLNPLKSKVNGISYTNDQNVTTALNSHPL